MVANFTSITGLSLELVEQELDLLTLKPCWNSLLSRSQNDTFFLTWDWVWTWWQVYGEDYKLFVLVARNPRDTVCGIAPLVLNRTSLNCLEFVGQNQAWGEYLSFIVEQGWERDVTEAICHALLKLRTEGRWSSLHFRFVRRDAAILPLMLEAFDNRGISLTVSAEDVAPFVELPDIWERYLEAKGPSFRKRVALNERRLSRGGEVRLVFAGVDMPIQETFDHLVALHNERWSKVMDTRFECFHRRLCNEIAPFGQLVLVLLKVGEGVVAAKYDFAYGGKIWNYQGGWSRDFARLRVGSVLIARIIEWAISRGFSEYDFLAGDYPYKRWWSTGVRYTVDLRDKRASRLEPAVEGGPGGHQAMIMRALARMRRRRQVPV
jgi:CelD/BcsL family acetyltransferase involved in cellulose biosynthesis